MSRFGSIFQLDLGRGFAKLMRSARARRFICSPPHTPQGLGRGYFFSMTYASRTRHQTRTCLR